MYNIDNQLIIDTGFGIIKEWFEELDEESLFYKLLAYMNKEYISIKDELNELL